MRKKINKKEWQWNKYNNTVGTVPCSTAACQPASQPVAGLSGLSRVFLLSIMYGTKRQLGKLSILSSQVCFVQHE